MSSVVGQAIAVYNRIWTLLENNADWEAMVKPGCRIKYNIGGAQQRRMTKVAADLPEVAGDSFGLSRAGTDKL